MKKTIPAKEIELCDVCLRESGYLQTCLFCGNRYCLSCEATIPGCISSPRICRSCRDSDDVLRIVNKAAPLLVRIIRARDHELEVAGYEFMKGAEKK